jgi:hypothetical protein
MVQRPDRVNATTGASGPVPQRAIGAPEIVLLWSFAGNFAVRIGPINLRIPNHSQGVHARVSLRSRAGRDRAWNGHGSYNQKHQGNRNRKPQSATSQPNAGYCNCDHAKTKRHLTMLRFVNEPFHIWANDLGDRPALTARQ